MIILKVLGFSILKFGAVPNVDNATGPHHRVYVLRQDYLKKSITVILMYRTCMYKIP